MTSLSRLLAVPLAIAVMLGPAVSVSPAAAGLEEGRVSISGTARVGETLTAVGHGWPDGTDLSFTWARNAVLIDDGSTHVVEVADLGTTLEVFVETSDSDSVTRSARIDVPLGTLLPGEVSIRGSMVQGRLTGAATAWGPAPVTMTYSWYRDAELISATDTLIAYQIIAGDEGRRITLKVSGQRYGYAPMSITSEPILLVKRQGTISRPSIVGNPPSVGTTLSIKNGTTSPTAASVVITWSRHITTPDGTVKTTPVSTGPTYRVTEADRGFAIRVTVEATSTAVAYSPVSAVSRVVPQLFHAPRPKIIGKLKVGRTVRVDKGSWSHPAHFGYQWFVNGKEIAGATGKKLVLLPAFTGKKISVRVSGRKENYISAAFTSKATKKVAAR